jgi:hypothetical protein
MRVAEKLDWKGLKLSIHSSLLPRGLRRRFTALAYSDGGFEAHRGHGNWSVVCCKVEVCATS